MRPAIVSGGFSSPQRLILGFGGGVTVIRGDSVIRGDTVIGGVTVIRGDELFGTDDTVGDEACEDSCCFSGSGEGCTGCRDGTCDDESG